MPLYINLFFNKVVIHIDTSFILFFLILPFCCGVWFYVVLLRCVVFCHLIVTFYFCASDLDGQNMFDQICRL